MPGLLVVMGSGETAPTMVKLHRAIFEQVDGSAVLLDTPYGFQENADDISAKAVGYFAASVGHQITPVSWRVALEPGLARDRALARLDAAGWIFSGPGSPTYALRQWRDTPVPATLSGALDRGAVVLFASAAAATLGSYTIPVYEIYKAGLAPEWVPGLDLFHQVTGVPAVVIPHYDNAEGGHHDTRYCYLGERRLSTMECELPEGTPILGVDEHTGVLFDLDARTATVAGRGGFTIRRRGHRVVHPTGSVISFDALTGVDTAATAGDAAAGDATATAGDTTAAPPAPAPALPPAETGESSLRADAERLDAVFTAAYAVPDVDGCVGALLDLEQVLVDWSADTLTSGEGDFARTVLRRMVLRLGELAARGAVDPRTTVGPFVEALLELRATARTARDFATADQVRDHLLAAGIEVRDTPGGVSWELRNNWSE